MRRNLTGRVFVLLMVVFSVLAPAAAMAQDGGLQRDGTYVSPQFGYTVEWGEDWQVRERDVISNPGGYDTFRVRSDDGELLVQGQGGSESASAAVERRISIEGDEEDVLTRNLDGDVPMAEMVVGRDKVLIEGYTLEDTDAVVVIVLTARERDFDAALASVHEQILFNGGPILTGVDVAETPVSDEGTVDLTEEPAEEATEAPTEEPTEEATEEPTEDATEAPAEELTETEEDDVSSPAASTDDEGEPAEPVEPTIEGGVFESNIYDYTVTFDEDIWTVDDVNESDTSDGITLLNDLGVLTIWSWDGYGADAEACLAGESEYYATEDPTIEDWEPADDGRGNPLEGGGEGFAWGVYTLTYVPEDGDATELVDYIECREIPGDDAVVIIFASAAPDVYNDHLEEALDVADAIEIEGEPLDAEATGESSDPEPEETETGLSGSLYTSPSFGFTVEIPAQWNIDDEQQSAGNEVLELSNGTSIVTLWATSDYQGDLAGCVDFAAEESGLELELDVDADGEPFRAEGRREAYAHFRYESAEGEDMMYFVSCQDIVEGESVLILTQDVPYNDFANQRKFRAELQDAIVMPE